MAKSETKSEAFKRLATKRTNAVIDKIRILGHCANPRQYALLTIAALSKVEEQGEKCVYYY